jgi:hypothetical protein
MTDIMARFDESVLQAKETRDAALKEAEETLQAALLVAAENFKKDLAEIRKEFKGLIREMQGEVSSMSSQISGLMAQIAKAQAAAKTAASTAKTAIKKTNEPKVPFAKGGLVTGPTNALIGEAGPELVIPLDRFESWMNMGAGSGKAINYYAAPNQSLDSETELFNAMKRAKVVVGW